MVLEKTLEKISSILKSEGCQEIFLFGSHVTGHAHENSDIDIGVRGLNPSKFFSVYARLDNEIPQKIDFVDFDEQTAFFNFLNGIGEVQKIEFEISQIDEHLARSSVLIKKCSLKECIKLVSQ